MIRLLASLFTQEMARPRHRPRHARRDLMADMTVPAAITPSWLPTMPTPAQRALDAAQADLTSAMEAWYRRHLPDGDLRATIRTVHEAQWAVTPR
jgi:hypothetical protein